LAIAIGRIGDLLLTDHLGLPTQSRFALTYVVEAGYRLAPGFGPYPAALPGVGESASGLTLVQKAQRLTTRPESRTG